MSQYITSPFKPAPLLAVAGQPAYLLGSYNDNTGPTFGYVQSDSAATTTATLVFQIVSGNIPVVGSLISVVGTANSAGVFNVTNVAIASVVCTSAGVCTVTYTIASTTQSSMPDGGQVLVPQPEVGETVTSGYTSVPVAVPFNNPEMQEGKSLTATLNLPAGGTLSAVTAVLQGSDFDLDSEYKTIHTYAAVSGAGTSETFQTGSDNIASSATPGNITANPGQANIVNYRFFRFKFTAATGSGKAIGKIEI